MARRDRKRRGSKDKADRKSKRGRKSFKYKRRDASKWKERAEQSGFSRRSMFVDGVKVYRPKDGDNLLRILPPTFEDADHYGFEVFVHYGIGPDNDAFLDLNKMQNDADPIVEERSRALKDNDKDYADKLTSRKRVLCYVIDRDEEEAGLQVWSSPWTLDADITTLAVDKRTGEVLNIDDPEDGYDIEFKKTGKGIGTKYVGVAIARRSSALDNDEALQDAIDMPLPETLRYYEYDEIQKVFDAGGAGYDDDEEEEEDDDEDDRPRRRGKKSKGRSRKKYGGRRDEEEEEEEEEEDDEDDEEEEVTWGEVMAMDLDDLSNLIEDEDLDIDLDEVDEDDEDEIDDLKAEVCDELGLEKPRKRKPKKSEKRKLRKRGRR